MHVSPSGAVNAYALSPRTAKSDGFTGAYPFTLGGGGGGGGWFGSAAAIAGAPTTAAANAPNMIVLISIGPA
jgi:hypothetical protein